ncbi:MAG TPA: hypothetical protein VFG73_02710 [Rhodanobacteraceae bacterium]|nr:hypothetical protein [Rhodanobacteraceae bacterium]
MATASFFSELRRRHVVRVAVVYAVVAWLLAQIAGLVLPTFSAPGWILKAFLILLALSFPVALALAWALEITPEGLRRTSALPQERRAPPEAGRGKRLLNAVLLVVLVAAVGVLAWRQFAPPGVLLTAAAAAPAKSVAVLPFENLSSDKDNGYFASGIQDMILTRLADVGALKVISRTSTARYSAHPDDLKSIARQLGVATILEGSVQKVGKQVLINVQLIDAASNSHIWAKAYTRTLDDVFGVEGEVAQKVADALRAELSPAEAEAVAAIPTRNPQAYDAYLRAEHYENQALETGNFVVLDSKALAAFREAVKLDPDFALAWAGLADAQITQYFHGTDISEGNLADAEANARHALDLAPDLPEAHLTMSYVYRWRAHDYVAARAELQRALQLRPNYADAIAALGYIECDKGHLVACGKLLSQAAEIDPHNSRLSMYLGNVRLDLGDYAGARKQFRHALVINPRNSTAYARLSHLEVREKGTPDAGLEVLESMPADVPVTPPVIMEHVSLLLMKRDFAAARRIASNVQTGEAGVFQIFKPFLRGLVEYAAGSPAKARPFLLEAVKWLQAKAPDNNGQVQFYGLLGTLEAMLGRADASMQSMGKAQALASRATRADQLLMQSYLARAQVYLGQPEAALDTLEKLRAQSGGPQFISTTSLRLSPVWDPLRKNPRFQALLHDPQHG